MAARASTLRPRGPSHQPRSARSMAAEQVTWAERGDDRARPIKARRPAPPPPTPPLRPSPPRPPPRHASSRHAPTTPPPRHAPSRHAPHYTSPRHASSPPRPQQLPAVGNLVASKDQSKQNLQVEEEEEKGSVGSKQSSIKDFLCQDMSEDKAGELTWSRDTERFSMLLKAWLLPLSEWVDVAGALRKQQGCQPLSKTYGQVFTVYMGSKKKVVLVGYDVIKDAFINHGEAFGNRPEIPIFKKIMEGHGIVFSNGETWKIMRRFALHNLRDFGMGKKLIELKIQDELHSLIKYFGSHQGKPFDTSIILKHATSNIICSILFGNRYEYDDCEFQYLLKLLEENVKLSGSAMIELYNYYPFLGFMIGAHRTILQNVQEMNNFMHKLFEKHALHLNVSHLTGFVDSFLLKKQQETPNPKSEFHEKNLLFSTLDLFSAGTETSSTTLCWGLLLMMKYPEVQKRVQDEINKVINFGRDPQAQDRKNMPYTEAVIHEIQRFANIVPMGVSRSTLTDVKFRGYIIPKGTEVIPLFISVFQDKTQWETPYQFNPAHFLNATGNFVKKDCFIPFGLGRRVCIGESLAKMELFLLFVGLLQKFTFKPAPGIEPEDLDLTAEVGFTLTPVPHLVCAIPRQEDHGS
ncbi:cytochrome P450 2K1-like [Macrotis lagotis]|uniref:cytochrome P450 2K1-like n=1 Tax=Macrotis lagotis TaxID=92651 RepID=UPI003D699B17